MRPPSNFPVTLADYCLPVFLTVHRATVSLLFPSSLCCSFFGFGRSGKIICTSLVILCGLPFLWNTGYTSEEETAAGAIRPHVLELPWRGAVCVTGSVCVCVCVVSCRVVSCRVVSCLAIRLLEGGSPCWSARLILGSSSANLPCLYIPSIERWIHL